MSVLDFVRQLGPGWPKERGWYALGLFVQTGFILWLIAAYPALRADEFFKSIATAIVVTGWIGFAVGLRDPAKDREQIGELLLGLNAAVSKLPHASPALSPPTIDQEPR